MLSKAELSDRLFAQIINYGLFSLGLVPGVALYPRGLENSAQLYLVGFCLVYAYFQFSQLRDSGQSIGKKIRNIKIVDAQSQEQASLYQLLIVRFLSTCFFIALPVLALIDIFFIFRDDKKCLHDILASTEVVSCTNEYDIY